MFIGSVRCVYETAAVVVCLYSTVMIPLDPSNYIDCPVELLKDHISTYKSNTKDLREPMRRVEQQLLHEYAGVLIGNQCLDFQKQDGVTEIEESIMANAVERTLNDLLLRDETLGKIVVNRKPIYVSCVSNFTNFLDLFRKTLRSLEVGIPCIILGRSNTVQHSYRWTRLLVDLCVKEGVDPGMITYLSCPVEDIQDITQSLQKHTGNLYSTCSRELAATIKAGYPNTVASTGGPNTLVALDWTNAMQEAIRMSATIESSGQCTSDNMVAYVAPLMAILAVRWYWHSGRPMWRVDLPPTLANPNTLRVSTTTNELHETNSSKSRSSDAISIF